MWEIETRHSLKCCMKILVQKPLRYCKKEDVYTDYRKHRPASVKGNRVNVTPTEYLTKEQSFSPEMY